MGDISVRHLKRQLGALGCHLGATPAPAPVAAAAASAANKRVWFIRHGESETNVSEDWTARDPDLTAAGRAQAERVPADPILAEALAAPGPGSTRAELVVVSPMTRTLRTAELALSGVRP